MILYGLRQSDTILPAITDILGIYYIIHILPDSSTERKIPFKKECSGGTGPF